MNNIRDVRNWLERIYNITLYYVDFFTYSTCYADDEEPLFELIVDGGKFEDDDNANHFDLISWDSEDEEECDSLEGYLPKDSETLKKRISEIIESKKINDN